MARRELGPAALVVAQAVASVLPTGPVVVGCSGGADSLALAMGARWAASRQNTQVLCVVVDHDLQPESGAVAMRVLGQLMAEGLRAEMRRVAVVDGPGGLEAAARDARLAVLAADGFPVLLGHTLDDQAESVLLGLLRGSGARSLAGMATVRGQFVRPLLGVRRSTTTAACAEWGLEFWDDPHNRDPRFRRVRARNHLDALADALGHDVAPALARSAHLARMDADLLDQQAAAHTARLNAGDSLEVAAVAGLPDALRLRVLRDWVSRTSNTAVGMAHVMAVDRLLTAWRGQGPVHVPGASVERAGPALHVRSSRA